MDHVIQPRTLRLLVAERNKMFRLAPSTTYNSNRTMDVKTYAAAATGRIPSKVQRGRISSIGQGWVPTAYRSNNGRNGKIRGKEEFARKVRGRAVDKQVESSKDVDSRLSQRRQEMEDWLLKLYRDLMRLAPQYRKSLHSSNETDQKADLLGSVDKSLLLSTSNSIFEKQVHTVLESIHDSDTPVNAVSFHHSATSFKNLTTVLQQMCNISCSISGLSDRPERSKAFASRAELLLLQLFQLVTNRKTMKLALKELERSPGNSQIRPGVKGWFASFVESLMPELVADKDNNIDKAERARDERESEALQALFKQVLMTFAETGEPKDDSTGKETEVSDQEYSLIAKRMMELYEKRPSDWYHDPDVLRRAMELLSRSGSIESARTCNQIYKQYNSNLCVLQFSTVLEAYLEASLKEKLTETKRSIIDEALQILELHWKDASPSVSAADRALQSSIILKCMAGVSIDSDHSYCERAETLAKQALGEEWYTHLVKDTTSCSTVSPPPYSGVLLNALAQVFGSSFFPERVLQAKRILQFMIEKPQEGIGETYGPTIDSCNAVFLGMMKQYENKSGKEKNKETGKTDLDFAIKTLEFMQRRRNKECVPNSDTHTILFQLLDFVQPTNVAEHGERLLSMFETAQVLSQSENAKLSLATYHRAMKYFLAMAKDPPESTPIRGSACERAFHVLQKLEIKSTPIVLSYRTLGNLPYSDLYDLELQPVRQTYTCVLHICQETTVEQDFEKAADVALKVAYKMQNHGHDIDQYVKRTLETISSRLPETSSSRAAIEAFLRESQIDESKCA